MAVAKRQGREKPVKIEQRKVKRRSEDQSEDLKSDKQHSWLSPICMGQVQGEEKTYKRRSQSAFSLSLPHVHTLSLSHACMRALSPTCACVLSLSLFPTPPHACTPSLPRACALSLSLSPPRAVALFSLRL